MRTIPDDPANPERASAIKTASTRVTLIVAIVLAIAKLAGWVVTGSMALLASAIDALVDTGASVVTLLGVRYAQRP
ncbi:MAG: cation transporter, partial [Hyphomicrobiales bacterium]|nr:cation transporter [Hyphomicrobiales bacterium]